MSETVRPEKHEDVEAFVAWAAAEETPISVVGAGTKAGLGRPLQTGHTLDLSGLAGITLYEPEELVLRAGAGTPLAEIERHLREQDQELAFEPPDFGPLFGGTAQSCTIGGVIACNLSGPRRIKAGAARDHFLGLSAVSGRGVTFRAGGRVVTNVTGYDLCKVLAGSYGTLGVMSEVTVKVLPAPAKVRTVLIFGLDDSAGVAALIEASKTSHEVSGLAHLPRAVAARSAVGYVAVGGASVTALRIEGPAGSVAHRCEALKALFGARAPVEELHSHNSRQLWAEIGDLALIDAGDDRALWRVSVPPTEGARVATEIGRSLALEVLFDWAGGLVWLSLPAADDAHHAAVRAALGPAGGHATLFKAADAVRAAVPVFQPQPDSLAALTARLRESFDPRRILNPGRMSAES
jgi:glycolate oxidase FAD binding subunit